MSAPPRLAVAVLIVALTACTSRLANQLVPQPPEDEAPAIVEVVNRTALAYRMSVVVNVTVRPLGTVPALETREFALPSWIMQTYGEVYLLATARDGSGDERVSVKFHVPPGKKGQWMLDATRLRTVVVR